MAINKVAPSRSKTALAKELGVSRASLYYKPKLPVKDLMFKREIEKVMRNNKAYGHKRIAMALGANKKRVLRVMKLFKLKPQRLRKKPDKPNDLGQEPACIPNLMTGIIVSSQNQIWVCDFTYLPYFGRFLYLATMEDAFTRQVVGWEVSNKHDAILTTRVLLKALDKHSAPEIVHSDQGSEYNCQEHLNLLKENNILPSMSAKGSPWQNGKQESFYSGFKFELGHPEAYPTIGELIEAIAKQIHYYNHLRIHTALKCSPVVFAERSAAEKLKMEEKRENSIIHITSNQEIREGLCV